ncbi:hypothetical protein GGU11DRAFT_804152, partial [Lentinula aff. detonsa]
INVLLLVVLPPPFFSSLLSPLAFSFRPLLVFPLLVSLPRSSLPQPVFLRQSALFLDPLLFGESFFLFLLSRLFLESLHFRGKLGLLSRDFFLTSSLSFRLRQEETFAALLGGLV